MEKLCIVGSKLKGPIVWKKSEIGLIEHGLVKNKIKNQHLKKRQNYNIFFGVEWKIKLKKIVVLMLDWVVWWSGIS